MTHPARCFPFGTTGKLRRFGRPVLGIGALAVVFLVLVVAPRTSHGASRSVGRGPAPTRIAPAVASRQPVPLDGLGWADGLALGVVEGITEFLPVSSTGHLIVTERLLDLNPPKGADKDALDSYTVIIQLGAILAVLLLYRRRVGQIVTGIGQPRSTGRRLLVAILIAFVPIGIVAKALEHKINDHLMTPKTVAAAWLVGGVLLLVGAPELRRRGRQGRPLESITVRQSVIIGAVQALALWPGVSRSLVTIVGGVAAGLTIGAAVEFSFLLGLATLSAASLYEIAKNGKDIIDRFGAGAPLIGIIAAFIAAAAAVNLFVEYLNRKDLRLFGAYRVGIAAVTLALVAGHVI